jgi:hypothetical protein
VLVQFPAQPDAKAENVRAFEAQPLVTLFSATPNGSSVQIVNPLTGRFYRSLETLPPPADVFPRHEWGQYVLRAVKQCRLAGLGQVVTFDANGAGGAALTNGLNWFDGSRIPKRARERLDQQREMSPSGALLVRKNSRASGSALAHI